MSPKDVNDRARLEWRELGFFYNVDSASRERQLLGSKTGLLGFRDLLLRYADNPRNDVKSEHDHYGPYGHLEIMTWPDAGMDHHAIYGSLADLRRLASLVEEKLAEARPGKMIRIREEYAGESTYTLVLDVRPDDFDPASADPYLSDRAG